MTPLSLTQSLAIVAVLALGTVLTRFLPFILFSKSSATPAAVTYLGKVLPYAAMSMLVVYCLKDIDVFSAPHGLPELIAAACTVFLHVWRRNTLLSIGFSTALYMFLIQFIF